MPDIALNAKHFEDMISRRGRSVLWEQAFKCSCWSDSSGQPDYSCKACDGLGYIYDSPMNIYKILIMTLVLSKEFTPIGDFRMGDCIATIPEHFKTVEANKVLYPENPMFDVGEWDKITLTDTEFRYNDFLIKGESILGRPADTLKHKFVTRILSVLKANSETGEVTFYEYNVDFILNNMTLQWLPEGNSPAEGEKYSIMYYYRPTYIVYTQLPQSRDPDGQHFPKKVVLRLMDVVLDG
jgi:hypothetical protein